MTVFVIKTNSFRGDVNDTPAKQMRNDNHHFLIVLLFLWSAQSFPPVSERTWFSVVNVTLQIWPPLLLQPVHQLSHPGKYLFLSFSSENVYLLDQSIQKTSHLIFKFKITGYEECSRCTGKNTSKTTCSQCLFYTPNIGYFTLKKMYF